MRTLVELQLSSSGNLHPESLHDETKKNNKQQKTIYRFHPGLLHDKQKKRRKKKENNIPIEQKHITTFGDSD